MRGSDSIKEDVNRLTTMDKTMGDQSTDLALQREPVLKQLTSKRRASTDITIAIVTTIVNPGPSFPVWLDYHLRRFDLMMVFMDDPRE